MVKSLHEVSKNVSACNQETSWWIYKTLTINQRGQADFHRKYLIIVVVYRDKMAQV